MSPAPAVADCPRRESAVEWTIWVVHQPGLSARSLSIEWEGDRYEVDWTEIEKALAAEVGEPEGIRAVIFDLVWPGAPPGAAILRFSVDPCDGPKRPAQLLVAALGEARCSGSLLGLAREGRPTDRFSHLDQIDDALAEALAASR
jgi:hypothetical protein